MPSLRLTRRVIDELPHPSAGQVYYRDTALPGFGLRVGARSKVYFAEGQVHGRTRRVTIGRADVFAPEVARKRALALLGDMAEGTDPNEQKRTQRTDRVTVSTAFERFFEARSVLSPYTVSSYQRTARLYLKSWNKTPLAAITRPMVLKKHQQLAAAHGETTANNAMRHLLEQLLFAIVRAHPSADGKTDTQRLNTAMKALVGQKASPNPAPGDRDDRALLFMGRERHCDEANRDLYYITRKLKPSKATSEPPKVRSDKALAELAADHYFNFPNEEARYAVVNRLREKFSGSYMRKQGKGQNVDFVATYTYRAVEHDYVQESLPLPADLSEILPFEPDWVEAILTGKPPSSKEYPTRSELVFGCVLWMLGRGVAPGHAMSIILSAGSIDLTASSISPITQARPLPL